MYKLQGGFIEPKTGYFQRVFKSMITNEIENDILIMRIGRIRYYLNQAFQDLGSNI